MLSDVLMLRSWNFNPGQSQHHPQTSARPRLQPQVAAVAGHDRSLEAWEVRQRDGAQRLAEGIGGLRPPRPQHQGEIDPRHCEVVEQGGGGFCGGVC